MIEPSSVAARHKHQAPFGLGSIARKGHAATCRAKNQMGFLLFSFRASIGTANGLEWAAPTKHRNRTLRQAESNRGAIPRLLRVGFKCIALGRLKAARMHTAQVNQAAFYPFNGVGGGFAVNIGIQ